MRNRTCRVVLSLFCSCQLIEHSVPCCHDDVTIYSTSLYGSLRAQPNLRKLSSELLLFFKMSCTTQGAECCAAGEPNNVSKQQDACCSSSRSCGSATSDGIMPQDDGWNIYRRALPKSIVLDVCINNITIIIV